MSELDRARYEYQKASKALLLAYSAGDAEAFDKAKQALGKAQANLRRVRGW